MLFSSFTYILLFFPLTVLVFFGLHKLKAAKLALNWLVLSSFAFYAYWTPIYILLLLASIGLNFCLGTLLGKLQNQKNMAKLILVLGLSFNLGLLAYYKYTNFALGLFHIPHEYIILPLAISFFTFQQVAYLVDSYRLETKGYSLTEYALFVSFFPQLIAGPIVHHSEMVPQFKAANLGQPDYKNLSTGLFIFSCGLFKKVVIADTLAKYASLGFASSSGLSFIPAWLSSLAYTFQIYFDFSGYCDMAIGSALCLNICLPENFRSPYLSLNLQEFWRTWHITLGRFLNKYLYIPLGGSRQGLKHTLLVVLLTMFLSGIWHGAGFTFMLWGLLHGLGLIGHRLWKMSGHKLNRTTAWLLTFLFVHLAWVLFRAENLSIALEMYQGLIGANGLTLPPTWAKILPAWFDYGAWAGQLTRSPREAWILLLALLLACICSFAMPRALVVWDNWQDRSIRIMGKNFAAQQVLGIGAAVLMLLAMLKSLYEPYTEFIYFNF